MTNLAHLLPVLDAPSTQRFEAPSVSPPALQLVTNNEDMIGYNCNESVDEIFSAAEQDRFQEGYDTGYALGLAQGRAQALSETAGRDVAMETYVAQARAQWSAEQGQRIADGLAKALKIIEDEIAACVERALVQMVDQHLRDQALEDFCQAVRDLLRFGAAGVVSVHAPRDLIEQLSTRLHDCATLEFIEGDGAQVWVRSGATMIEARLDAWVRTLTAVE